MSDLNIAVTILFSVMGVALAIAHYQEWRDNKCDEDKEHHK
jgi:hypothetical protein